MTCKVDYTQGGICSGEAGELPPHWIWPSLPLVWLKT